MEISQVLTTLIEAAPLVLAVLILAGVVLLMLYAAIKVIIPALRETVEMFEAQRSSWKSLIDEQKRFHERLSANLAERIAELESESKARAEKITALECEIEQLRAEDKKKTARIGELENEIKLLRDEDKRKATRIGELENELKKVMDERDELRQRLDALEATRNDGNKPAEVKSDAKKS